MTQISAYLSFNGNCREAMSFYRDCLGGRLSFRTIGESPLSADMPERMKNSILSATLRKGRLALTASDITDDKGLKHGNSVSMMLECSSEKEMRDHYSKLSEGSRAAGSISRTFKGELFAHLTDKYGYHWLLHFAKPKTKIKKHITPKTKKR